MADEKVLPKWLLITPLSEATNKPERSKNEKSLGDPF